MKAGLIGPSYQMKSLNFDAQRTVNLYPVKSETGTSKEVWALYGTPGLKLFAQLDQGPTRGFITCGNGRTFVVSRNTVYELDEDGEATNLGTISTYDGLVSMDENGQQVFIATNPDSYVIKFSDDSLNEVDDEDFPGASYVTFQDGYFIITRPDSGEFYISDLYDGLVWDALDFATAESSPDNLVAAFSAYGQLWLYGVSTMEPWYNSGDADFPYARAQGAKMEIGCAARFSIAKADNTLFWVGQDKYGKGIVYRAQGYNPQRISTQPIELRIRESGDLTDLVGFCYQQEGHLFYTLTGGYLDTSLVVDAATQQWHERAYLNNGLYEQWRGIFHCFAFDKNLTGDRADGKIYEIDPDYFTDNGQEIRRSRTFSHYAEDGQPFRINYLQVDFETGVGLNTGQGSDPKITMQFSTDGGHTWSSEYEASIGRMGQYGITATWRRLGQFKQVTFRINVSEPVKIAICGAYFG